MVQGPTVLEALDAFENRPAPTAGPFRMPVQGVYKFTANNDDRRIVAGTVESGRVAAGDEVVFYPSGKKIAGQDHRRIQSSWGDAAAAEEAAGFYADRTDLCRTRRDRRQNRPAEAARQHADEGEPVLAGQEPARSAEGISAQARHRSYAISRRTD